MNLDKSKVYCPICLQELHLNDDAAYEHKCSCYNGKRFKYVLVFCDKCGKYTSRRGVTGKTACNRCAVILQHKVMAKQDPEGYAKRQSNACKIGNEKMKSEGKGVWSKEQHILAETTKRENGTDLGNQEFRKKIGCNGNSQEVIQRQKDLGIGIFRDDIRNNHKAGNCVRCGKFNQRRNAFGIGTECGCLDLTNCFKPNFKTIDSVLHYYDKSNNEYVPWEEYKLRFVNMRLTRDVNEFVKKVKSLDIFQPKHMGSADSYDIDDIVRMYSTFRDQNSWEGKKGAFEQNLVENGVNWFTYIKFYINNKTGAVRPLVVGKSGSLNVNVSGSDVCFSEDVDDGPARRFLNETSDTTWDSTKVLVIKAKSEKQSYYYEYRLQKAFRLFES